MKWRARTLQAMGLVHEAYLRLVGQAARKNFTPR
jgi:hypothetical protein